MNFIRMAARNLFKQIKEYYLFITIIAISTAVIFNVMNVSMDRIALRVIQDGGLLTLTFCFLIVFIAVFLGCYVSYYFSHTKTKELGIIGISGGSVVHTALYLSTQNLIINGVGAVIGIIGGLIISPIYMLIARNNLSPLIKVFHVTPTALGLTVATVLIECTISLYISTGYCYRKSIKELLVEKERVLAEDKRAFKINPIVYCIVYLFSLIGLYFVAGTNGGNAAAYIVFACVFGTFGIIRYGVPKIINKKRSRGNLYHKEKMIWTGNLVALSRKTVGLLTTMMVGIVAIDSWLVIFNSDKTIKFMLNLQLMNFMILISLAIIYRITVEVKNRVGAFKHLKLMGYTKNEIKSIIFREAIGYYLIFAILVYIPILDVMITSIVRGAISIEYGAVLIAPVILLLVLLAMITYYRYKRIIMREI